VPRARRQTPAEPARAYEVGQDRVPANYTPLTPLHFLARSASVYPDKIAVVHGDTHYSYAELHGRCRRLASALTGRGIGRGDTVAIVAPNTPALLEAHFGVPMAGAVLNAINVRQDAASIAFYLEHGEAKLVLVDRELSPVVEEALGRLARDVTVVGIDDPACEDGKLLGEIDYEGLLEEGDAEYPYSEPADEWQALSLLYTSGTTGKPKGVVYSHRGAYVTALGNVLAAGLTPASVYLWTLPMFHCNGWCFLWALVAVGGTQVCLRRVEPEQVFAKINRHGVTHMCGAPTVLNSLIHAPKEAKRPLDRPVEVITGGAAPPSAVVGAMKEMGFRVTHTYGATELYGPATVCAWQEGWESLSQGQRAAKLARQGVAYPTLEGMMVADPATMQPVPRDGKTLGEIMLRGNSVMRGYLKNPEATHEALAGGWYHSGDLAVWHADGYAEIKDRSKDVIISGGENISSLEVEEILYGHPAVMEAAVVAKPDDQWGETPCAFVHLTEGAGEVSAEEIMLWSREKMAHFKAPKTVVFGPLPKTSTGKIQKFLLRERAKQT
jgi:fatty-acyl-CoA synthase